MKKILTILVMSIFLMSFMSTAVLAQNSEVKVSDGDVQVITANSNVKVSDGSVSVKSGTNVGFSLDDKVLSTVEIDSATIDEKIENSNGIWRDRVSVWFADKERKAEIKATIAAKKMHKLGEQAGENPDKAEDLAEEYNDELDSALEDFEEIAVDGDKEKVFAALKQTVIMKYRLETHKARWIEVHAKILERQSERMTEEQLNKLEEVFSDAQSKLDSRLSQIEELQENLISRAIVVTDLSESEIRKILADFEASLENKRQLRDARLAEHRKELGEFRVLLRERIRERIAQGDGEVEITDDRIRVKSDDGEVEITDDRIRVKSDDGEIDISGTGNLIALR